MPHQAPLRHYLQAGALYVVFVLLLFWKVLFSGLMMVGRDAFVIFYPWRHFLLESYRQGIIPLWNPYTYSGQPFLANLHSAVLYPLNVLLFLGPLWYSMAISVVVHILLAGFLMYVFLRATGSGHGGALLGGMVYLGSGWFVKHLEVLPHIITVAWTPLVFWCFERGVRDERRLLSNPYLYLGGAVSGLQIFSGHPLFLYTQFGLLIYALFRTASRQHRPLDQRWHVPLTLLLGTTIISSLLAAAQLLPALEYSALSNRVSIDYGYATQLSLPPIQLLTMAAPYLFGDPGSNTYWGKGFFWLTCLYVGVAPLFLAAAGAVMERRDLLVRFALFLALATLLFTLGKYTPAYRLIFALPVFDRLRYPTMFVLLYTFAVGILAARGFDALSRRPAGRALKFAAGLGASLLLLFLLILLLAHRYNEQLLKLSLPFLWLPGARSLLSFANRVGFQTAAKHLWMPMPFLGAGVLILLLSHNAWSRSRTWRIVILLVVGADLLLFGMKLKPLTDARLAAAPTPTIKLLQQDAEPFRLWTYHRTRQNIRKFYNYVFHHRGFEKHDLETMLKVKDNLPYNVPMVYRFSSVIGYDSLKIGRYRTFGVAAENEFQNGSHRLLDLLNTRYILASEALFLPGLKRIRDGELKVYRNHQALPRAYLATQVVVEPREEAILNLLRGPSFNPLTTVIFEEAPPVDEPLPAPAGRQARAAAARASERGNARGGEGEITAYEPNRIRLRVQATQPAYLVLSEINYPGWRVRVDGRPARPRNANFIFRAVYLSAGRHEVEWYFSPWSIRMGGALSLMTCLFLLIVLAVWWRRKRRPHHAPPSR